MARVVSHARVLSAPFSPHADFYRAEFTRHRQCLAAQREYFSERAITEADEALARVISQLEQLCAQDDAEQVIAGCSASSTRSPASPAGPTRRSCTDVHTSASCAITRTGFSAPPSTPSSHRILLERCVSPLGAIAPDARDRSRDLLVVAAGKAAWPMATAFADSSAMASGAA